MPRASPSIPLGGNVRPGSGGRRCWSRRSSAAAASRTAVSGCWQWSLSNSFGKTVAPGPLYPVSVVLTALVEGADPQAHADTIESLMSGAAVASWAVSEPGRGWAPSDPSVTAARTDSGYRIDGTKIASRRR